MDRSLGSIRFRAWCATLVVLFLLSPNLLCAARVVLRISAGNPIEEPQTVQIKANLPDRVTTNDILSRGGLDLGYDVKNDTYYVHGEVELGPKEVAVYDVEMRDIWLLPEEQLQRLVSRAGELVAMLQEFEEYRVTAAELQARINATVAEIRETQAANQIGRAGVTPPRHIRAYDTNLKRLADAQKDVGSIENLVLASGQDPGTLVGEARDVPPPRPAELDPEAYGTAIIRITVQNTSPNRARTGLSIHRDLPQEITPADVLDAGGLEVGTDSKRGVTYVYLKDIDLAPNEVRTFDVEIRDKWNVNAARITTLRARIEELTGQIGEGEQYQSIDASLEGLDTRLTAIGDETGPENLSSEYVAFHRDQAERLDEIEKSIYRIEAALRPVEKRQKRGFRVQPPSMKTTWLIIYIILGFLALVSLLFLLRWMGKSKPERMEEKG